MTKAQEQEKAEAIARLRELVKPGDTVYTVLRHVSKSGMLRVIDAIVFVDGQPCHLSWNIAKAVGYTMDRDREGVKVSGCGMDMGFDVVYNLSRTLWPNGYGCPGKPCHSNDHSNGDRDYTPHGAFSPSTAAKEPSGLYSIESQSHKHWHNDGGYALNQRWL